MAFKYLTRTPTSNGNTKTWTWSAWVKRGRLGAVQCFNGSNQDCPFQFDGNDQILLVIPASTQAIKTTRRYRDSGAWYHIVIACDTTQATASNRLKIYTNGVLETALDATNYPTLNVDTGYNSTSYKMFLGANRDADILGFDGTITDFYWVDGQALDASYFGQTSSTTGQWIPKAPSVVRTAVGNFGTNGCYLPFSNKTSTTTLGYDYKAADRSGTLCDWGLNNFNTSDGLTEGYDANFAILSENYGKGGTNTSITQGGLQWNFSNSSGLSGACSTLTLPSSGKWFFEFRGTAMTGSQWWGGVCNPYNRPSNANFPGYYSGDYCYGNNTGEKSNNNVQSSYGASWTTNDVIGVLADVTAGSLTFYKNGVSQTAAWTGLSMANWVFIVGSGATSATIEANFGQGTFVTSNGGAGYQDANGRGKFQYAVPSGALALCEKNITDSAIVKPSTHFDTVLWTGNGGTQNITGMNFKPDLVWIKARDNSVWHHQIIDAVRGPTYAIFPDGQDAQGAYQNITAFNSDGFTLGTEAGTNNSGNSYVGWCWKGGNGTVSNTSGTITSTVSANQTAGFSIAKYTGNGSATQSYGHGLGVAPKVWIWKALTDGSTNWILNTTVIDGTVKYAVLNSSSSSFTSQGSNWGVAPTSSVININGPDSNTNLSGKDYISYQWAEVPGYSKFGTYLGNNNTDGTLVYTGFKPAWVLIKYVGNYDWHIYDNKRDTANFLTSKVLKPTAAAEFNQASTNIDFYSNGFKTRGNDAALNFSGGIEFYMAFAEAPPEFANAR